MQVGERPRGTRPVRIFRASAATDAHGEAGAEGRCALHSSRELPCLATAGTPAAPLRSLSPLAQAYRALQLELLQLVPADSPVARVVRAKDAGLPPNLQAFMRRALAARELARLPAQQRAPQGAVPASRAAQPVPQPAPQGAALPAPAAQPAPALRLHATALPPPQPSLSEEPSSRMQNQATAGGQPESPTKKRKLGRDGGPAAAAHGVMEALPAALLWIESAMAAVRGAAALVAAGNGAAATDLLHAALSQQQQAHQVVAGAVGGGLQEAGGEGVVAARQPAAAPQQQQISDWRQQAKAFFLMSHICRIP